MTQFSLSRLKFLLCVFLLREINCNPNRVELALRHPYTRATSPIFIHASSFEHLVEQGSIFIDRSLLIAALFQDQFHVHIITMPNGFGKTMNLRMIQTFFEIQVDDDGNAILPRNETSHYALFKRGEIIHRKKNKEFLKHPLLIATHEDLMDKYQGQYPVVYVSFGKVKGNNFDQVVNYIRETMSNIYEEYEFLLRAFRKIENDPSSTEQQKLDAKNNAEEFKKHVFKRSNLEEAPKSLSFLCKILHEYYNKKVILLVDDYDAILNHTLFNEDYSPGGENLMIEFYQNFISSAVQINVTEKIIFSGVLLLRQGDLIPVLNNSKEYNIWANELLEFYGCSDNFTEKLFETIGFVEHARSMIRSCRLGYRLNYNSKELYYDPLTVACNLGSCVVPRSYDTFFYKFFNVPSFRNAFSGLASGGAIPDLNLTDVYFDQKDFRVLKTPPLNESTAGVLVRTAMKYLFAAGYLTISNVTTGYKTYFQFPNEAMQALMKGELLGYFDRYFRVRSDILHTGFSMISTEITDFIKGFEKTSEKLELLMGKYYKTILEPGRIPSSYTSEEIMYDSINFLAMFFDKFKTLVTFGRQVVLYIDDYVAAVIEGTLGEESAEKALEKAKNWTESLSGFSNFNMFKFIGINVHKNTTVDVLADNKFYGDLFVEQRTEPFNS